MNNWQFCFLSDQYYKDFPNHNLMQNKEIVDGRQTDRPCFFAFKDALHEDILWLIPISSKYDKYKSIYDKNIAKYGRCEFIRFGNVLGTQAAFLIQNMCPITEKYIKEVYVDKNDIPVQIDNRIVNDIVLNAKNVLAKVKRGVKLVFPDVLDIKKTLLNELNK